LSDYATTSQTVGPFFQIGLSWLYCDKVATANGAGPAIEIAGRVIDADGNGVSDALIEVWQADASGNYLRPEDPQKNGAGKGCFGFGRIPTAEDGSFRFTTIKPGRVRGPGGKLQAPHIVVSFFCRGLLRRLITRIYFSDDPANAEDFALNLVDAARRETLIAKKGSREGLLEWDLVLQGPKETVFFDV
jgi:protocatechuate 3,4-dioxygenase alpha subunit